MSSLALPLWLNFYNRLAPMYEIPEDLTTDRHKLILETDLMMIKFMQLSKSFPWQVHEVIGGGWEKASFLTNLELAVLDWDVPTGELPPALIVNRYLFLRGYLAILKHEEIAELLASKNLIISEDGDTFLARDVYLEFKEKERKEEAKKKKKSKLKVVEKD